ncbi:MAG TPA: Ig-like domain-containing protein [Flavobacteriaceae bacterium]|nr:Ig-like domain-containing protein [Flavobacteriaceae bacterium]
MKKYYFTSICMFLSLQFLSAQTLADFEDETDGAFTFTSNGQVFNINSLITGQTFKIETGFPGLGWTGTGPDDVFIDNVEVTGSDLKFSITASGLGAFTLKSIYIYLEFDSSSASNSCTITGKLNGVTQFTATDTNPSFNYDANIDNGFTEINMASFGGSNNSNVIIDEYIIEINGIDDYLSLDAMTWQPVAVNSPPVFTSATTANVVENTSAVMTVTATDADSDPITYSITGGADSGDFNIDTNSGALTFASAPDFENPADSNTDNVYTVQVTASDGTDTTNQTINVTVTDVDDTAPVVSSVSVPANATYTAGQNMDFTVNSSENVTVNTAGGIPRIALTIGASTRYASYLSGSGTSALVFRYTVQTGDSDLDGIAVGAAIEENGATLQDAAGNNLTTTLNSVGSTASVLVDAVAPAAPSTPDLAAASDDGVSDTDNTTADNTPTFTGTAEANATVTLISSIDGNLGTTIANGTGNWSFTPGTALSDNTHNISATATDAAGNTSSASSALSVTIDTSLYSYDNGVWTPQDPNGNITATDDVQVLSGTASFNQNVELNNLTVASGATLNIEEVLTINGDIVNNGNLVFVSNASGTGQLGIVPAGSTITGNVTVERYIPARRAFRFVSPAVTTTNNIHNNWQEGASSNTDNPNSGYGTHITGNTVDQTNGFDGTPSGNPSLFGFDNTGQAWTTIANTDVTTLTAGTPLRLFVRGDRSIDVTDNAAVATNTTLRATGSLETGIYTNPSMSQVANGYNFIGNPYQAIVDMNSVLANSINLNPNHYYVWDPNLSTRGAYVTVSLPLGSNPSGSEANQFLQPGQGAFLQTATNGPAFLVIAEGDKAVFETGTNVFRPGNTNTFINVQLWEQNAFISNSSASDGLRVNFSPSGSNAVLSNDATKLGNLDENLAVVNGSAYLSIEHRALPVKGETLELFVNQYRFQNYVFKVETANLGNVTAYLQDNYLGTQTQLANNAVTTINFNVDENVDASVEPDRFSIVFDALMNVEDNGLTGFSIYPNPVKNDGFFIRTSLNPGAEVEIVLHDLLGRQVFQTVQTVAGNHKLSVKNLHLNAGIYLVKISHNPSTGSGQATHTEKLIIE